MPQYTNGTAFTKQYRVSLFTAIGSGVTNERRFLDEHQQQFSDNLGIPPFFENRIYRKNFSDGAGHGYLIATDSIFARLFTGGTGVANTAYIRLLYRFKEVDLAEYIGIVQSQS